MRAARCTRASWQNRDSRDNWAGRSRFRQSRGLLRLCQLSGQSGGRRRRLCRAELRWCLRSLRCWSLRRVRKRRSVFHAWCACLLVCHPLTLRVDHLFRNGLYSDDLLRKYNRFIRQRGSGYPALSSDRSRRESLVCNGKPGYLKNVSQIALK